MNTEPNPNVQNKPAMPTWVPAKFWDDEKGEIRTEDLARSYQELEQHLHSQGASNIPDAPSAYEIMIDDDLLDVDDEVNQRLFDNGFSQEQAQLVYDLAKEKLLPVIAQMSSQFEEARDAERLHQHFGGQDRFEAARQQLKAWGEANLPPNVYENLVSSADGVIAMAEMMQSREPALTRNAEFTPGTSEDDLKRMMKDPRYWKERDPAFVGRVRDGFKKLYPGAN
ncbi:hypothetical protein V5T82_10985 [Magnetovibrio sp. PR-2]|uniref:capsid assembly protein n=1 Tax=Magnetovibrio sp. PR-2 TaxID=3120356 RepID=UPI002FCE10A9